MAIDTLPVARHVITRARRTAAVTIGIDRLTSRVRALCDGTASTAEARTVVDGYCRHMGLPHADDAALEFLMSPRASRLAIEDIDELLQWGALLGAPEPLGSRA